MLWWTNLEDGVPDLETEMDPQPIQRVMKRKRKAGKSEKLRRLEGSRNKSAISEILEDILEQTSIQHDCGTSPACPAWYCASLCEKKRIEKEIQALETKISELEISNSDRIILNICKTDPDETRNPVSEIVKQFENLNVDSLAEKEVLKPISPDISSRMNGLIERFEKCTSNYLQVQNNFIIQII